MLLVGEERSLSKATQRRSDWGGCIWHFWVMVHTYTGMGQLGIGVGSAFSVEKLGCHCFCMIWVGCGLEQYVHTDTPG
jgi:hypothetical protein